MIYNTDYYFIFLYLKSKIKNLLIGVFNKIPFFEKPLPEFPFGKKPWASKNIYLNLHRETAKLNDIEVVKFEKKIGYAIDIKWITDLALKTQIVIKKESLNYFHGRLLYSVLSKYLEENKKKLTKKILILETGTARGFSALCMSKAIRDSNSEGTILTLDCIPHNKKIYWNCIVDNDGPCTRSELLNGWPKELNNIIFFQGWTKSILKKIGCERINFAFLDAQHTMEDVLNEFNYVAERQISGDIVVFDDVTPGIFDGVCAAIERIEKSYPYAIQKISFASERGYAIARKI